MLIDREQFINIEYLDYTKKIFDNCFRDDIELIEESYSNESGGMGFYRLTYEYRNKPYQIIFEYERLYFTIRINYKKNFSHLFSKHKELDNGLDKYDIKRAIQALKKDIDEDALEFYTIKKMDS